MEAFPDGGSRQQLTVGGGSMPLWSQDDSEIFYYDAGRHELLAVPIEAGDELRAGDAEVLMRVELKPHLWRQFDVSADGERILVNRMVLPDPGPIRLLFNWREALERLARAG